MCIVKKELGMALGFLKVPENRHSTLILVGAFTQGCLSPLIYARTKCSKNIETCFIRFLNCLCLCAYCVCECK